MSNPLYPLSALVYIQVWNEQTEQPLFTKTTLANCICYTSIGTYKNGV
ncbi:hypothetical protein LPE509_02067 [Legionella pneumophila subsp. pneumophila LPE509]|nr:hypothetical protein LPE509_02067 [Legionella pneumophila subsp. pneumophila LPE509]